MFGVLNVYLKNRFCGQLSWESERNRYIYRYAEEYLADPKAERLSLSLPLQSDAFDEDVSYRFFANLLPPEVVRRKLEKCLHVSRNNVFGFLKEIGRDCAGAVALCPPGIKPNPESDVRLQELDESRAVEILKGLKRRPLFAVGERGYRYSAAGAQDKLVVRYENGKLFLPLDGTPSTHIVKPGLDDFAESVAAYTITELAGLLACVIYGDMKASEAQKKENGKKDKKNGNELYMKMVFISFIILKSHKNYLKR